MVQIKSEGLTEADVAYERKTVNCEDYIERFSSKDDDYTKQFFSLYVKRLEELSVILKEKAKEKWSDMKILPLAELENYNKKCVIIGTLYKHQPNKPSILQELSEEHQMSVPAPKSEYCSDDDQLFLEDQTSRIKLTGKIVDISKSVTGVVCAVLGQENEKSTFEVEDWCFAGCPRPSSLTKKSSGKILFLSGLELASNTNKFSMELLLEWLLGFAGKKNLQEEETSIVRVVIAGNSIKGCADVHLSRGLVSGRAEDAAAAKQMTEGTKRLDDFLENLGQTCCVTIMPGQFDITTLMMPQRPMHPGSFPKSRRLTTIKGVTNPWVGKIDNRIIVGTSGQPIQDMLKVCGLNNLEPIDCLEKTLEWRHLSPTGPDTIPSLPFHKNDPFILKECPDIYFSGNMEKFDTKLYTGNEGQIVRLICIPKFASTQTGVIVDLDSLDATPILFGRD